MKLVKKAVLSIAVFFVLFALFSLAAPAATTYAADETTATEAEEEEGSSTGAKALAAALAIGLAAGAGTVAMGFLAGKSTEGIARQPEAEGKIRTTMILGIVFIETAVLYALMISILIIFVL